MQGGGETLPVVRSAAPLGDKPRPAIARQRIGNCREDQQKVTETGESTRSDLDRHREISPNEKRASTIRRHSKGIDRSGCRRRRSKAQRHPVELLEPLVIVRQRSMPRLRTCRMVSTESGNAEQRDTVRRSEGQRLSPVETIGLWRCRVVPERPSQAWLLAGST